MDNVKKTKKDVVNTIDGRVSAMDDPEWKEKYLKVKESFHTYKDEEENKNDLFKKLVSNLIILSKTEEDSPVNETLNEIKNIISKEIQLSELKRALNILRELIFKDDPKEEKEQGETREVDYRFTIDIFMNITFDLKQMIKGDLKKKVELLEQEIVNAKDRATFKLHVKEVSSILTEYREIIYNERLEIERFLQELTANIIETEKSLTETLGSQNQLFESNTDFNEDINNEIKSITRSFDISKTLDEIKKRVFEKIRNISTKIKEKREIDKANERAFNSKLTLIKEEFDKIKKEASEVKKKSMLFEKEATIDPLTKALNRRGYEARVLEELERLKRYSSPCSMIMLDIDNFKEVNDKYGHAAGDKTLSKIGELIKRNIRKIDVLGRYGGEEFLVILPNIELEKARKTAEKIRSAVYGMKFLFRNERVIITVSGGVTEMKTDDTLQEIYNRVDESLYKAKKGGKNCVRC